MIVGAFTIELAVLDAHSLKDKRRFLKSVIDRFHNRLRISIAETAFHDLHQRTEIGLAFVSANRSQAEKKLEEIHRLFEDRAEAHLLAWDPDCIEFLS